MESNLDDDYINVKIEFTPTVPHCTLATLIGLCIWVKINNAFGDLCKIELFITPGSHPHSREITKQMNDKERLLSAKDNVELMGLVNLCLRGVINNEN